MKHFCTVCLISGLMISTAFLYGQDTKEQLIQALQFVIDTEIPERLQSSWKKFVEEHNIPLEERGQEFLKWREQIKKPVWEMYVKKYNIPEEKREQLYPQWEKAWNDFLSWTASFQVSQNPTTQEFWGGSRVHSYKNTMFSNAGYGVKQLQEWLTDYIKTLPEHEQPLFTRAQALLGQAIPDIDAAVQSPMSRNSIYQAWEDFITHKKPISLTKTNPFLLPQVKSARLILLGEDHTYHYPAEQMVENIIAYNKTAPEGKKITHLFVEFAYQGNVAMEYIREHIKDGLDEATLLKNAVAYSQEQMGKHYINASLREQVRWLRLGYRLLKENSGVHFYAYDMPSPEVRTRNAIARAFEQAVYEQPSAKAVFIGGALHMLRKNIHTEKFESIIAEYSLANIPTIPAQEITSIFITGGKQWEDDKKLYDTTDGAVDLYELLLEEYRNQSGNWALKTDPVKFGFDYYFVFDSNGVPVVTDANYW